MTIRRSLPEEERLPRGTVLHMRIVVGVLFLLALATAWFDGVNRVPSSAGTRENETRSLEGWIVEKPVPMLRLERVGTAHDVATHSLYLLCLSGKFGAADVVAGLDGVRVRLRGRLIYREDVVMVEVVPDSIEQTADQSPPSTSLVPRSLGSVTLIGEIVSAKCFYGGHAPAFSKTHRACSIRHLSGGIPPALAVRDEHGAYEVFPMVSSEGEVLGEAIQRLVGKPVRVTARAVAHDDLVLLFADVEAYSRFDGGSESPRGPQ